MTNHPNRSRRASSPAATPAPEAILAARTGVGLTQRDAAGLLHSSERTWQDWERGERRMHPAFWDLFRIRVGLITADGSPCG